MPAYAWTWLQRSRPVLAAAAERLTGGPPAATFLDDLRAAYETDPFTRAILADVIVEVAFAGRVPAARPGESAWDRGLEWWAAALGGRTPPAFQQQALFDAAVAPARPRPVSRERRALAAALRELVRSCGGEQVPASAVRQLAEALDPTDGRA